MTEELRDYLRCNIATDSMESLCNSINEIGPYVSGLAISNPLSVSHLHYYTFVGARRNAYRQFHIPKKSGGVRTITAPDGELKDVMLTLAFISLSFIFQLQKQWHLYQEGRLWRMPVSI